MKGTPSGISANVMTMTSGNTLTKRSFLVKGYEMVCRRLKQERLFYMEKIIWIYNSPGKDEKAHMNALNKLLSEGWSVKMMSACAAEDYAPASHLYIVLEK